MFVGWLQRSIMRWGWSCADQVQELECNDPITVVDRDSSFTGWKLGCLCSDSRNSNSKDSIPCKVCKINLYRSKNEENKKSSTSIIVICSQVRELLLLRVQVYSGVEVWSHWLLRDGAISLQNFFSVEKEAKDVFRWTIDVLVVYLRGKVDPFDLNKLF